MSTEVSTRSVTRRCGNERYKKQGQKSDSQQSTPRNAFPRRTQHFPVSKFTTPSHDTHDCGNCGRKHPANKSECPANRQTCRKCGKRGHFAKMCRSGRHVQNLIHAKESDGNKVEIIHIVNDIPKRKALVTLLVNNRDQVSFQLDTGASVNIQGHEG